MKKCKCKDWKENDSILTSALMLYHNHGFGVGGLNKSFTYCPYCGNKLEEIKENE